MRLQPPDQLTTVLLYASAIQMAVNAALAPGTPAAKALPGLTMAGIWPYVPIILLSVAAMVWIVRGAAPPPPNRQDPSQQVQPYQPAPTPSHEPWHAKLNGFQIYFLIYMALYFIYLTVTSVVGKK